MNPSTLQFKSQALTILANLSLREYLRPIIYANEGVQIFLDILHGENPDFSGNV
jgi:hypothetical protein